MTSFIFYFILLASVFAFVEAGEFDLTIQVEPGRFQCFFQPVTQKHKTIEIDYNVIEGGDLNINFMLILGANTLLTESLATDGSHKLEIKEIGDYQICFDNTFSYQSSKIVFFEVFLYDQNGDLEEEDISKYAAADPKLQQALQALGMTSAQFQKSFEKIKNILNKVEYYQSLVRSNEARDRFAMTHMNNRVFYWALSNTTILIAVGILQVYMIRSLFEDSRISKVLRR